MKSITVAELKVGDYFYSETRRFKGLILQLLTNYGNSFNFKIDTQFGKNQHWYFYNNEKVSLLNTEEIEVFKLEFEEVLKYSHLRKMYKPNITMGSDPEIFVVDKNNEVIPSYLFLKSKKEKDLTDASRDNFHGHCKTQHSQTIFWDGFQGEFNVESDTCLGWVHDSIFLGLKSMAKKAKIFNKDARLTLQSTLTIPPMILQDAKDEHVEFGCMPSLNVYGMEGIKKNGREVPFRSAGGHIHFGLRDGNTNTALIERYVKTLDKILGVACVSLFAKYDKPERREMYGLAGEYRLPDHGLEYRTLSNGWLSHPLISNMVFELARMTISFVDNGYEKEWNATEEETIKCINTCDVDLAREILTRNKGVFKSILYSIRQSNEIALNQYRIYMLGLDSILDNPEDIEGNWGVAGKFEGHCEGKGMTINKIADHAKYKELEKEKVTEIYEELVKEVGEIEANEIEAEVPRRKKA